jgi:hypothetical protein
MTVVTPRTLTRALREHLELWLHDYLGVAETQDGLEPGTAARPADAHGWGKTVEWPPTGELLSTGPVVWIVDHGVAQGSRYTSRDGAETRARRVLEVAAICHPSPPGTLDGRHLADLYGQALHQLLDNERAFGDGDQVVKALNGPYPQEAAGADQSFPAVVLAIEVDCAIGSVGLEWAGAPDPLDPPREPETPVSALSISTTVEAQQ